jgi:myo-inositol-1(or 4)-monophosphatase
MRAMIEARFPDHGIVGEEYGVKEGRDPFSWILDPVDGTRSFIFGTPTWTTLIALAHEKRPVVGVMHQPYVGESFLGSPSGSFHRRAGEARRLAVNPATSLGQALGTTTGPHLYRSDRQRKGLAAMQARLKAIRYDADAYFFCLLAAGQIDIALDAGLAAYDIAPLIPIIEGAGGIVTTWDGASAASGGDILAAASPSLQAEAMSLLAG